jgi:hypothetical protein
MIAGIAANFTVTVTTDGAPISLSGSLSASVYSMDGKNCFIAAQSCASNAAGANWAAGVVVVSFTSDQTATIPIGDAMLVLQGGFGVKRFRLIIESLFDPVKTSLFIKDIIVDEMRADRLVVAAAGALPSVKLSDEYIWEKIRAAESELSHKLRVFLVPTHIFPDQPTQDQIDALNGQDWVIESSPDYEAAMFAGDRWGYIVTREKPVISVTLMRWVYPTQNNGYFDIPVEWLSIDKKYGHIRVVPTSNAVLTSMAGFIMMNIAGGRDIPSMIRLEYTAGLTNVSEDWPEILDLIKKMAVLKIINDAFLPQSGSISADGLSESISLDIDKYNDIIDITINGVDKSGNGGLMAKIHGIRTMMI